jgi:hypothetical protein
MPMIAMTTSISISVNAARRREFFPALRKNLWLTNAFMFA